MQKLTPREEWYFIRQDIHSYLISTAFYVALCLLKTFTIQSAIYAVFDCLVFYIPFWFIRINFADTYHSDSWKHCKMWTRIMLCTGVFVMWALPIPYTLFNGLFVAFVCCLILYLVALETNEKKRIIKENQALYAQVEELLEKTNSPEQKILDICKQEHINARNTKVAIMYYIERRTPKDIWMWLCDNNENMELDSVYKLLNRLNKKILGDVNKNNSKKTIDK